MVKGAFAFMEHDHFFEEKDDVITKDVFVYGVPYGLFGRLFDKMVLKKYMTSLLATRNQVIKEVAERNIEASSVLPH